MNDTSRFSAALVGVALGFGLLTSGAASANEPRRHGDLVVHDPPRERSGSTAGQWRHDLVGTLTKGEERVWVGMSVPHHVPIGVGELELYRLVPAQGGLIAAYLEPFGTAERPGCAATNLWENCGWLLRFYGDDEQLHWEVDVKRRFPRPDHLALRGFALAGDTLYHNEACQTYAAEAKGRCSQVVAVDVSGEAPVERWRSAMLTSNTDLVVMGRWVVTGYGFTAEKDYVYVLDAKTGKVAQKAFVKKAPERIEALDDERLSVLLYDAEEPEVWTLAPDGRKPRLRRVAR